MNTVVLVKQVPDTASRIKDRVKDDRIELEGVTWVANPYDEFAVEEALRLKEAYGGTVSLIAFGPERVDSALKDMLALGADDGFHVWDDSFEGLDAIGTAKVLAAAVRRVPFDMVWTGWKGVDFDQAMLPSFVAHELGLPYVAAITGFELKDRRAVVRREVEGGTETLEVGLPAVFGAQKGLNEVRYASLKGIMAVKRKEIPLWSAADLEIDASALPAPTVEVLGVERPAEREPGRVIPGEPAEAARELARLLHEEAKVI